MIIDLAIQTEFFAVNDTKVGGNIIKNVFSTRSNVDHTQKRSLLTSLYKMSTLLQSEELIDTAISAFCKKLDEEFIDSPNENKVCKIDEWLLFFAWDVIGYLTFSKPMGFMDKGRDYSGLLSISDKALDYFAVIGQIPSLDFLFAKNPITPIGPPSFDFAAGFCAQQSIGRQQDPSPKEERKDMLDDFLALKRTKPDLMDDNGVVGGLLVNILAGSDTTGKSSL